MDTKGFEKYFNILKEGGAEQILVIDPSTVVTAPWVFYKCKFGCKKFGTSHICPPESPNFRETREILNCYSKAILFTHRDLSKVRPLATWVSGEAFADDYYKSIAMASGPCDNCKNCSKEHCNFPGKAVPAMEACGIDVFQTARNNGIEIHTVCGKEDEAIYLGMILMD